MPDATIKTFNLDDKTPSELEARRRDIIVTMKKFPLGYDDPGVPEELLQELAVVTSTLRRKNAGPPKEKKASTKGPKALSADDLLA